MEDDVLTEAWMRQSLGGDGDVEHLIGLLGFEDADQGWAWLARMVVNATRRGREVGAVVRLKGRHVPTGRLVQVEDEAIAIQGLLVAAIGLRLRSEGVEPEDL